LHKGRDHATVKRRQDRVADPAGIEGHVISNLIRFVWIDQPDTKMTRIGDGFQRGSDSLMHPQSVGARSFICSIHGLPPKKLAASEIRTELDDSMNVPTAIADTFD